MPPNTPMYPTPSANTQIQHLSFYVRVEPLEPNYQVQSIRHGEHGFWAPPNIKNAYIRRPGNLFRWKGGRMTRVATDGPLDHSLHHVYSVATIFTQNPDTPHLLVVPFDAGRMDARRNAGGWRPLTFDHKRIGNTQHTYSALTPLGNRQHIAAPGSRHWMPQLLPRVYDYQPQPGTQRVNAGLIGSLPLLFALAAFSAPPSQLTGVLETCIRPGVWQAHQFQYPAGHIAERGMVVTIYLDPGNPQHSTEAFLNHLQNGNFGPFYGR